MSDDQDGCEWVSVSSGPGQKPLNGCVCVLPKSMACSSCGGVAVSYTN